MLKAGSLSSLLPPPKYKFARSQQNRDLHIKQNDSGKVNREISDEPRDGMALLPVPQVNFQDFLPLRNAKPDLEIPRPTENEVKTSYLHTKALIDKILGEKLQPQGTSFKSSKKAIESSEVIQYALPSSSENGEPRTRSLKIVEHAADPLQPKMFKVKKVVAPADETPTPVLSKSDDVSRTISSEERSKWNIPSAISSWKNPNGYAIALDKRLGSDTRYSKDSLEPHEISDKFAKLSEALDSAERMARQEVKQRADAKRELAERQAKEKEEKLRVMARQAREERSREMRERVSSSISAQRLGDDAERREAIRRERRKQLEKDLHRSKRSTADRLKALAMSQGRDISDKVILGAAKATESSEIQYDSRLFARGANANAHRSEDQVYDNPLFVQRSIDSIYHPNRSANHEMQTEEVVSSIQNSARFSSLGNKRTREGPVEFTAKDDESGLTEADNESIIKGKRQRTD
ncbi:LAFE_0D11430g1_1 [Lachancea fermentati]|uniref:Pre-mRNA-processing protein 45 n=1 Tax=Lachancea fermentati TaxID=4955 RepID=A0A1G4MC32_LACFM|nr:LAFE_0D11430g1_1 [Lachancea fermentati]